MIGTIINSAAILLGTLCGVLAKRGIPERLRDAVMQGQGLCIVLIGLSGALKTTSTLCMILSIVLGSLLGAGLDIERRLNNLGERLEKRLLRGKTEENGGIARGFVSGTLMYCVGAMAIVGAMNSGLHGDHSTLIAKALLDGVISVFLASSLGIGVALSAVSVFLYQGLITLLSGLLQSVLTDAVVTEMGAVGGLLVAGVGLNMIYDKHISVGNMLPAMFLPIAILPLMQLFS
jgi:uncharacterized protein